MKFAIQYGLSLDGLRNSLPERCRAELKADLPPGQYALIIFRCDQRDVVLSRVVESALSSVATSDDQKIVAVAGCFTVEGLALLRDKGAIVLQTSEWHWTDESYKRIRGRR